MATACYLTFFALVFMVLPVVAENRVVSAESIQEQLAKSVQGSQDNVAQTNLRRFYAQRNYQPVWTLADHATLQDTALMLIKRADEEGLSSNDYRIESLRQRRDETPDQVSLAFELDLTRSLLALAHDLRSGRLVASLADPDWHIPQQQFDPVMFLQQAVTSGKLEEAFADLPPGIPQYRSLKQLLLKFRALMATGIVWARIPEGASSIHPRTSHAFIPLIRQRIQEAYRIFERPEYDVADSDSEFYDDQLEGAVKVFQRQYGLNADGIIGKNTRQALDMTPDEHIRQLRISLERLRWLPRKLGNRYILVNIAGFYLVAVQDNARVFGMRIVVGRDYRSTPSFNSRISHLVLNPYWNIPTSIARKDLLPKQRNNPGYFASEGIRVFSDYQYESELDPDSIDWYSVNHFPYVLRQDPGRKNALGTIKFMFPNPFSIYLHDTPSKYLFQKDIRAFSSGCIRLEKPLQLAEFVLGKSFERADIAERIRSGKTQTVNLSERVPVYLLYLTAWSNGQGEVYFSSDVYGRDRRALAYARW
ncbi:L,D-transpeptidase family protein [Nitrosomonas sp. HPC101]|uniref:L,D-transpeptidase family protein n=1 Tax=Nitrosomonas sp. HPC101 TaxID=1658667 RepID=UPI001F034F35|nr:L,D-transpeptidase family protein [Nitrosomonas sp. HPC101]